MLSSLLTDICLDTISSTTKFSPVIGRCNFAGVNGMSLHLQTEKLKSITPSWQRSAARPGGLRRCSSPREAAAPQERSPDAARRFQPGAAAPSRPVPPRLPLPPSRDPPAGGKRRRGSSAVTRTTRPGGGPDPAASPGRSPRQPPLAGSPAPSPWLPAAAAGLRLRPPRGGQRRPPGEAAGGGAG